MSDCKFERQFGVENCTLDPEQQIMKEHIRKELIMNFECLDYTMTHRYSDSVDAHMPFTLVKSRHGSVSLSTCTQCICLILRMQVTQPASLHMSTGGVHLSNNL